MKILDIGSATGYPFIDYLYDKKIDIYGIDVSEKLINECRKKYPNSNLSVSSAENLSFESNFFDMIYCFHTTWHFEDFFKSIKEMFRAIKDDGKIIIDVMNADNEEMKKVFFIKCIKDIIKKIIYYPFSFFKYGRLKNPVIHYEKPVSVAKFNRFLYDRKIIFKMFVFNEDNLKEINTNEKINNHSRLIYIIQKENILSQEVIN